MLDPRKKKFPPLVGGELTTTDQMPTVEPQARPLLPPATAQPNLQDEEQVQQAMGANDATPSFSPVESVDPSPYDVAKSDYETAVATPAEKQPLWKQALFLGLQGLREIGSGQMQDYQLLGNAQKDYKVEQAAKKWVPLEQQRKRDEEGQQRQANIDYTRTRPLIQQQNADTARLRQEATAEYQSNMAALGKSKADEIAAYREQIIDLQERRVGQNDARIKLLEKRIEDTRQNNIRLDEDRDAKRNLDERKLGNTISNQQATRNHQVAMKAEAVKIGAEKARQKASQGFINAYKKRNNGASPDKTFIDKYLTDQGL
jgi:hypothetical protein